MFAYWVLEVPVFYTKKRTAWRQNTITQTERRWQIDGARFDQSSIQPDSTFPWVCPRSLPNIGHCCIKNEGVPTRVLHTVPANTSADTRVRVSPSIRNVLQTVNCRSKNQMRRPLWASAVALGKQFGEEHLRVGFESDRCRGLRQ